MGQYTRFSTNCLPFPHLFPHKTAISTCDTRSLGLGRRKGYVSFRRVVKWVILD